MVLAQIQVLQRHKTWVTSRLTPARRCCADVHRPQFLQQGLPVWLCTVRQLVSQYHHHCTTILSQDNVRHALCGRTVWQNSVAEQCGRTVWQNTVAEHSGKTTHPIDVRSPQNIGGRYVITYLQYDEGLYTEQEQMSCPCGGLQ